jgi:WD40 repeat protein
MVTLVLADVIAMPARSAGDSVNEVTHANRGECVAPASDGPLMAAFASAQDGLDAARELAGRVDARVAVVTGEAEPRAGGYVGETASAAARLLTMAERGQVVIDDPTAETVDGRLPPEISLAEVRDMSSPTGSTAWILVAPGLPMPPRAATCPYRGLVAFGTEDEDLYFGREEVVASVVDRLIAAGFLAVVGASGSGKSSLVRAGLVPAYRHKGGGRIEVITPGADPVAELRRSLSAPPPSLLIVDQLEELFTVCSDDASRTTFLDSLLDLRETGSASIVVALRADFYGRCAEHPRLAAALAEHQLLLGPMRVGELRRAIDGPARAGGLRLEAGLIDTLLADVDSEPGALPLLSHALYESWGRRDGRVLTRAGYLAAGGVRGAIAQTAEKVFSGCRPREQVLMRRMFLRLTELGDATGDTRRRVSVADLVPEHRGEEAAEVVERLASARLLVVDNESAEIAHEALIREWPRLRGWLAEDREKLRMLQQLTSAARSWEEAGRDEADLYRGPRLAAAEELAQDERQLSRVERAFLDASQDAQTRELRSARRRARRLRGLLAGIAAALVVAVITGSIAVVQRGRARHTATVAQAGRLAAQSREVAAKRPDVALLLALEAGRLDDSVDTRGALLGALEQGSRIRTWLQGFTSPVNATAFSPDGGLLATLTHGETTLWDTATWKPVGPPLRSRQGGWEGADFSPDGRTLAIAGGQGRVELWDVSTRRRLRALVDPAAATSNEPALAATRFSPDGSVVAAGGQEANHVTLWEAATGRVLGRPITVKPPGTGGAQWISFSPDSRRIAVPGAPGSVGIWEIATGRRVGRPLAIGSADVDEAIFAQGGRTLIAGDDAGFVSFVEVGTGRPVRQPLSVGDKPVDALALSPDGRLLAAGSYEGPVFVWDLKTGAPYGAPLSAETSPVNDVAFSPDGRMLVSAHLRSAVVWNMNGERAIGEPLGGPNDLTTDLAFSPDGRRLVAGQLNGDTVVYDTATWQQAFRLDGRSIVTAVAFHPHGKFIALGTIDGKVRLFDTKGAAVGRPLDEGNLPIWQIAFSPNGRLLAVAVDRNGLKGYEAQQRQGVVQLWDVRSRRRVGRSVEPGAGSVLSLAFSADGTLLATGSYKGRLDLWDVATRARVGQPMRVADDGFASVSFDPSGGLVAGGGASGLVRVWRVSDGRPAFPSLSGHSGPITGASFAPTGSFLATTSLLGGTRLWDAATGLGYGDELVAEARPASLTSSIDLPFLGLRNVFSPDGKVLAVAGVPTRAMLWDADPVVWRERACAIAGRNLHREEWKLYLPAGTPYRATCTEWPTD